MSFVQQLREQDLKKLPSISETVDWAKVLLLMHADKIDPEFVRTTLNVLLKFETDIEAVENKIIEMTRKANNPSPLSQ